MDKASVRCYISQGSMNDIKATYKLLPQLPSHSLAIGNKGCILSKLDEKKQKLVFN